MKITSWNVNSVRARLDRVLAWLGREAPDLFCLQETKVTDDQFPREEFEALGYRLELFGQKAYNGVAMMAREPLTELERGLPGDGEDAQKRLLSGRFDGIRVMNAYVPNGYKVGSDKYAFKLEWLDRLHAALREGGAATDSFILCGDFNIAPEDRDVHDPKRWRNRVLCSEPEREKFRTLLDLGLSDALRLRREDPGIYTWWDYRLSGFERDWGLRLDHFLVSKKVAGRIRDVVIDREERAGDKPSDHAPVTLVL